MGSPNLDAFDQIARLDAVELHTVRTDEHGDALAHRVDELGLMLPVLFLVLFGSNQYGGLIQKNHAGQFFIGILILRYDKRSLLLRVWRGRVD